MAMIFRDTTPGEMIGGSLANALKQTGQGFGEGLSSGFQALANMKMQDYAQRQQMKMQQDQSQKFWKGILPNAPDEVVSGLSAAHPSIQKSMLDRLEGLNVPMGGPSDLGGTDSTGLRIGLNPQERRHREQIHQQELAREQQAKQFEESTNLKKQAMGAQQLQQIRAANKPFHEKLNRELEIANNLRSQLPGLEKLLKTGKLSSGLATLYPHWNPFASKESKAFADQLDEVTEQITAGMPKHQADAVRNKFAKLMTSPRGHKQIVNDINKLIKIPELRNQAYQDILEENNGIEPTDLENLVENRIRSKASKVISKVVGNQVSEQPEDNDGSIEQFAEDNQQALETYGEIAKRIPTQIAATGASHLLGMPQEMATAYSALGGPSIQKAANYQAKLLGLPQQDVRPLGEELPSQEGIQKNIGEVTGGYTMPKNEIEAGVGNFIGNALKFMVPIPGLKISSNVAGLGKIGVLPGVAGVGAKTALKTAAGMGLGGWLADKAGAGPTGQALGSLGGAIIGGTLGFKKEVGSAAEAAYKHSTDLFEGHKFKTNPLVKKLSDIYSKYSGLNVSKSRNRLVEALQKVTNSIDKGEISFEELKEAKRQFGSIYSDLDSTDKELFRTINNQFKETISDAGKQSHKLAEAAKSYHLADDLTHGLKTGERAKEMATKLPEGFIKSYGMRYLFGNTGGLVARGIAKGIKKVAPGFTESLKVLKQSKGAQKIAQKMFTAASMNDLKTFKHYAHKLDEEFLSQED